MQSCLVRAFVRSFALLCACAPDVKADHYQRHHLQQKAHNPLGEAVSKFFSPIYFGSFSSCMELHFTGVKPRKEK